MARQQASTCGPASVDKYACQGYHAAVRSRLEHNSDKQADFRELDLLTEIQATPKTSQRYLAARLGISLAMTNLLLRNIARKGYARVTRARWRGWMYALTPAGFSRKIELTVAYVHHLLEQYQWVRQTLRQELEPLALHAESRVAILGTGDYAELVYLQLKDFGVEEMDVYASGSEVGGMFLGMPVSDVATLRSREYDCVVVALLRELSCDELRELGMPTEKVVTLGPVGQKRPEALAAANPSHQEET